MSDIIASLRVALGLDDAQFQSGAKRAQATARTTATSIERSFGSLKNSLNGFLGALTIGAVVSAGKAALEYASHLTELGETLGLTAKDLQEFSYAAGQVGVSQEDLQTGIQKLTISMGKAQAGSQAQIKAFNAIGVSLDDLKNKDAGAIFRQIADRLQTVSDRSQRAAIEVALFGKSGAKLDNLLSGAEGSLDSLTNAAEKLGIVLSDEQIANADRTADKLEALETVLKASIAGAVADNASAIYTLVDALGKLISTIPQAIAGWKRAVAEFNAGASAIAMDIGIAYRGVGAFQNPIAAVNGVAKDQALRSLMSSGMARFQSDFPKKVGGGTGSIGQFLAPGGGGGHKAAGGGADELMRKQLDALQKSYQFTQEQLRAEEDILNAKKDLATDYVEQTSLEIAILDKQREQYQAELANKVKQNDISKGKDGISQAQADQLMALYDQTDQLKRQKVIQDEQTHRLDDIKMLTEEDYNRKRDILQKQADLADTQAERRQIELQLLHLAYQEKQQALQRIIDTSKDAAEIENARRDLSNLNTNYALDRKAAMRGTAGPLEAWANSVPHTAAQINEALQSIEVEGLNGIADAISGIVTGSETMGQAFQQVAKQIISELTAMIVKMLLFKAIQAGTSAIGGGMGGGVDFSGIGAGINTGVNFSNIPVTGFATGGSFSILGKMGMDQNMLSLNGLPIARVSHGERISIGNDNARSDGVTHFNVNVNGAMSDAAGRRTGMQIAAGYRSEMARSNSKGIR